jgi:hypothetical protein
LQHFSLTVTLASGSARKSLQHVSSKNAGAGKLCALFHQVENSVFPLAAENGKAAQIDHQFSSAQIVARSSAGGTKFSYERIAELALHHEPPLGGCIDDRNPEHNRVAIVVRATHSPKLQVRKVLKGLTEGKSAPSSVNECQNRD